MKTATRRFLLPRNNSLGAYFVIVELRPVNFMDRGKTNVEHLNLVRVYVDMQFNPLHDKLTGDPINVNEAVSLLQEFSPIEVSENFNHGDIDDLRTIKSQLSPEFIEKYNLKIAGDRN